VVVKAKKEPYFYGSFFIPDFYPTIIHTKEYDYHHD